MLAGLIPSRQPKVKTDDEAVGGQGTFPRVIWPMIAEHHRSVDVFGPGGKGMLFSSRKRPSEKEAMARLAAASAVPS